MKKKSKKTLGIGAGALAAVVFIALAAIMVLRVDSVKAKQIALSQAGGGEIIQREISSEGLWNEYSYTIQNGDTWYEIEIGGFGGVEELESGRGIKT